ncbi:MAG: helix-turn-helix domain-containing protein, partial [Actinomycetota bacterium]|nr:helix-turn-helix domain-containing protein [Actinomycetota bacterium]
MSRSIDTSESSNSVGSQQKARPTRPWEDLDPAVATALRPGLPALVDDVVEAVREGVPAYRRPLEGTFGRNVRIGVEVALGGFLELVESGDEARLPRRDIYVELGRGELRDGRTLEALLAAYRAGAQVSWRRFAAAAEAAEVGPRTLIVLAEAMFAYIDELSAASAEGYAREQSAAAGELQTRRRRLVELLSRDPPSPLADIERAAEEAGWSLPASLAALAFEIDRPPRITGRLPPDVLVAPVEATTYAFVPDPDAPGRRAELERAVRGAPAGLGQTVRWPEAARSVARAELALELAREGSGDGAPALVVADEHMLELLLAIDGRLGEDIARARLAPLRALRPDSRRRLSETLRAWLGHWGEVRAVAAELGVHPQSVRYRVGQLREAFGAALDDPAFRLELALA